VDGRPVPKIIDFGVAKATSQRLTAETMFTRVGALIGTPEYMSPEQADSGGEDIDTRTDVYSLGVVLYELLVGVLPLDLTEIRNLAFHEVLRRI
jgi:eukaryotic-like serine/threonine-protein kinase